MKGALVQFASTFGISTPNIIIFQYNPETIRHSFTQSAPQGQGANPLAVPGNPGETFSLTLAMDATDQLAEEHPVVVATGIYARLAALETLMFPVSSGTGFIPMDAAERREVPAAQLPTVLFVWGPGRIVPVRVTSLTVTEKLFDSKLLNPTHAEAQIELRVLTPAEIEAMAAGPLKQVAIGAYNLTHGKRVTLSVVNLANAAAALALPAIPGI